MPRGFHPAIATGQTRSGRGRLHAFAFHVTFDEVDVAGRANRSEKCPVVAERHAPYVDVALGELNPVAREGEVGEVREDFPDVMSTSRV